MNPIGEGIAADELVHGIARHTLGGGTGVHNRAVPITDCDHVRAFCQQGPEALLAFTQPQLGLAFHGNVAVGTHQLDGLLGRIGNHAGAGNHMANAAAGVDNTVGEVEGAAALNARRYLRLDPGEVVGVNARELRLRHVGQITRSETDDLGASGVEVPRARGEVPGPRSQLGNVERKPEPRLACRQHCGGGSLFLDGCLGLFDGRPLLKFRRMELGFQLGEPHVHFGGSRWSCGSHAYILQHYQQRAVG